MYILTQNNQILYVGRSKTIYTRLSEHKSSKQFDTIFLIEFHQECINQAEKDVIKTLNPLLNIKLNKL